MVISMEENKTLPIYVPIILDDKEQKRREYEENTPEEERFARELNSQRKS